MFGKCDHTSQEKFQSFSEQGDERQAGAEPREQWQATAKCLQVFIWTVELKFFGCTHDNASPQFSRCSCYLRFISWSHRKVVLRICFWVLDRKLNKEQCLNRHQNSLLNLRYPNADRNLFHLRFWSGASGDVCKQPQWDRTALLWISTNQPWRKKKLWM